MLRRAQNYKKVETQKDDRAIIESFIQQINKDEEAKVKTEAIKHMKD